MSVGECDVLRAFQIGSPAEKQRRDAPMKGDLVNFLGTSPRRSTDRRMDVCGVDVPLYVVFYMWHLAVGV